MKKPGRNDACPCGSGQKFKKCCQERINTAQEIRRLSTEVFHKARPLAFGWPDFEEWTLKLIEAPENLPSGLEDMWINFHLDYGWSLISPHGKPVLSRCLEEFAEHFSPEEQAWMKAKASPPLSLHRAEEVSPGRGVLLVDELHGSRAFAYDVSASEALEPGWGCLGRVVEFEGIHVLSGLYPVACPPALFRQLVERCQSQRDELTPTKLVTDYEEVLAVDSED